MSLPAAQLLYEGLNAYMKDCAKLLVTWERTGKKPDVSKFSHDRPKSEAKDATRVNTTESCKQDADFACILDSDEEEAAKHAEEAFAILGSTTTSTPNRDAAV